MTKTTKDTQAEIMGQFDRGDAPEPGPLRWLQVSPHATPVLQQQWKGPVSGRRIWVVVPTDPSDAEEAIKVETT